MGRDAFLSAMDLVALALIPKLATHCNHLNTLLIWKGVKNKNAVGEFSLAYLLMLTLYLGLLLQDTVFGVQHSEKTVCILHFIYNINI